MSSIWSPGSTTMASCVWSSPRIEQLHCNGPTGMTLWITKPLLLGRSALCRRLHGIHDRGSAVLAGKDRKSDRRNHEEDCAPGRQSRQCGCRAAGPKSRLASHAAKGRRNLSALAVLEQHDHDQNCANENVNHGNQIIEDHFLSKPFRN